MRAGKAHGTNLVHTLQNGHSERRALDRVCTCPQLVKERERPVIGLFEDLSDVLHVSGESAEALGNALLVSDIRKYVVKYTYAAVFRARDHKAALCHKVQQARGFKCDRFSARIRAGDYH